MKTTELMAWQQELRAGPKIYFVTVPFEGSREDTGNYYDCALGAQLEVDWRNKRKERAKLGSCNIHTLKLSIQRWLEEPK